MFNEDQKTRIPVTLTLTNGRKMDGDLITAVGGALERTLNNDLKFITFCPTDGEERLMSKTLIEEAVARKQARVVNLPGMDITVDEKDPYTLLRIARDADNTEIRNAYLVRAKAYHPDRFSNVSLPPEVAEYTNAMSRRINEAYGLLMQGKHQSIAAEPIFA